MKNRKREICTSGSVRDEDGQPPHLLGRRKFLHLAAGAAALPVVPRIARAQAYPTRPVHLLEGFGAGAAPDIIARLIGQALSERLGQSFVVENRAGASSNIAAEAVVRAAPDGYTLFLITSANAVNATMLKLNFDLIHDLAPVASISRAPFVMEVHPFPANTVAEFIAYAKANPGKINFASGGTGYASHLSGELFKMMTGVNMVHVPYRGQSAAMTDLLGDQVQIMFDPVVSSLSHIQTGKLRPLAVTTSTRSEVLPDIPTVGDFLPGYEASIWFGVGAPRNTPSEIVDRLNKEINAGLTDPKIKSRFAELGGTTLPGSPADFGELIADETEKWGKVIKFAGIKAD